MPKIITLEKAKKINDFITLASRTVRGDFQTGQAKDRKEFHIRNKIGNIRNGKKDARAGHLSGHRN